MNFFMTRYKRVTSRNARIGSESILYVAMSTNVKATQHNAMWALVSYCEPGLKIVLLATVYTWHHEP